MKKASG